VAPGLDFKSSALASVLCRHSFEQHLPAALNLIPAYYQLYHGLVRFIGEAGWIRTNDLRLNGLHQVILFTGGDELSGESLHFSRPGFEAGAMYQSELLP
jgi:hypothetical protein